MTNPAGSRNEASARGDAGELAEAGAHYAAGRIDAAAAATRAILAHSPGHLPALHLLAATRLAAGALDEGAALLEQVLAAQPGHDEVRLHLAAVRTSQGRHDAVVALLRDLVVRRPEMLAAYAPLAAAQWELGDRDGAIASYRGLLARAGHDGIAQRNLGNALRLNGDAAGAVAVLQTAVRLRPDDVQAHIGLAEALAAVARLAAAGGAEDAAARMAAHAALALCHDPRQHDATGLLRLGVVLHAAGDLDAAITCLRGARTAAAPGMAPPLAADPTLLVELANALSRRLDHDGAAECYRAVLAVAPDHIPARVNLALLHLLHADFATGWAGYEWRRPLLPQLAGRQDPRAAPWIAPADLRGTTVRLVLEQGHGDTLQFIRYAALLAARGARVEVTAKPAEGAKNASGAPAGPIHAALLPLLARVAGIAAVLDGMAPDTAAAPDIVLPLLSLPLAFATDLASIPAAVPYLSAPPDRRAAWQARLGAAGKPRIGVVWSGSPIHGNDRHRSIPLARFRRLLERRDVEFHVLAERLRDGEAAALDGLATVHPAIADFADTAALAEAMDLVITVDTAVAHLAGGLGRPTWVLLPCNPDWRWLLGRADSPWYPSVTLFRQTADQDWDGVLARVRKALDVRFS